MKTKIMMQVLIQLFKWNCFRAVGKIIIKNFIAHNVLRIREADNCVGFVGRDWRFTLYAVIGCPSFAMINNLNK